MPVLTGIPLQVVHVAMLYFVSALHLAPITLARISDKGSCETQTGRDARCKK